MYCWEKQTERIVLQREREKNKVSITKKKVKQNNMANEERKS